MFSALHYLQMIKSVVDMIKSPCFDDSSCTVVLVRTVSYDAKVPYGSFP